MPRGKKTENNVKPNGDEGFHTNPADNINYVTPNSEFPFVYANNAVMSVGEMDGSIIFGEVVGSEDGKTLVIPKAKVVMSLPFIAKLHALLGRQLEARAAAKITS